MSKWNIRASTLLILSGVIFLMLLIVILPDVDLPDTAFHRGTAPSVVHDQATAPPPAIVVAAVFQIPGVSDAYLPSYQPGDVAITPDPNSIPILLRSIRR